MTTGISIHGVMWRGLIKSARPALLARAALSRVMLWCCLLLLTDGCIEKRETLVMLCRRHGEERARACQEIGRLATVVSLRFRVRAER
jgi:hypothetical protein